MLKSTPTFLSRRDNDIFAPAAEARTRLTAALVLLALGYYLSIASTSLVISALQQNASDAFWAKVHSEGLTYKSTEYYVCYSAHLLCVAAAGLLALSSREARRVLARRRTWCLALGLYLTVALVSACRTFSLDDWLSKKALHPSAFAGAAVVVVLFCALDEKAWPWIEKIFISASGILSALVVYTVLTQPIPSRLEGVEYLMPYLNPLFWLAAWVLLKGISRDSPSSHVYQYIPLSVYIVGSVFAQTRVNLLMAVLLIALWLRRMVLRRRGREAIRISLALAFIAGCYVAAQSWDLLSGAGVNGAIQNGYGQLMERLYVDTRSGQYEQFFSQVSPFELILGRGSMSAYSYYPYNSAYTAGLENLYMTLAFFGGLPLLGTYLMVHAFPIRCGRSSAAKPYQWVCAQVIVLYLFRMLISQTQSLSIEYYSVVLCVGGCLSGVGYRSGRSEDDRIHRVLWTMVPVAKDTHIST